MGNGGASRDKGKARARLALRAEKAFGVNAVAGARKISRVKKVAAAVAVMPTAVAPVRPTVAVTSSTQPPREVAAAQALPVLFDISRPFAFAELSATEKSERLSALDAGEVKGCTKCALCEGRTHTVFGEGDADAKLMFIGEGPGENEDLQGRPFVGRAGKLLDDQIRAMGLTREQIYIANVVKCRPPNNRTPAPEEASTCMPYLERQIEIVRPRAIVTLGLSASQQLLQTKTAMGKMRGIWASYRGVKVMPTFHPAYILRSYTKEVRAAVWSDLQKVMAELGLKR